MRNKKTGNIIATFHLKFGLNREEAATHIGIGRTKFDELVQKGVMPQSRSIGSRRLWARPEVEASFLSMPVSSEETENSWGDVV